MALPMHLHAEYLLNNLTTPLIGIYRAFGPTHALTDSLSDNLTTLRAPQRSCNHVHLACNLGNL